MDGCNITTGKFSYLNLPNQNKPTIKDTTKKKERKGDLKQTKNRKKKQTQK